MTPLPIPSFDIITLITGVATSVIIVVAYQLTVGGEQDRLYQRRRAAAQSDRRQLRAAVAGDAERKARAAANDKVFEDALSKLKLQQRLDDNSLKLRLARAGIRRKSDQVKYLLALVCLPPFMLLFALAVFHFVVKMPDADTFMYGCVAVGGLIVGYLLPGMRVDSMAQDRLKDVERNLPDALDLLTICVEAGMSTEQGFSRVAKELGPYAPILSEELELLTAELSYLGDRKQAYENLVRRTNSPTIKTIMSAFAQAERYGTPIGQALRVISAESRFNRMAAAEEKAAALPAKLTVPMMIFFVPALFIVILGPAILQMMAAWS